MQLAMVGLGKQRRFREKLAAARRVQDDEVIVAGAADETQPAAVDPIDRDGPVALIEQGLAGIEPAHGARGLERGR